MKKFAFVLPLLALSLRAQLVPQLVTAQGVDITAPPLSRATTFTSTVTTHQHGTYYYWVIANLPRGQSWPDGPFIVYQAPDTLTIVSTVSVSWTPVTSAVSYDVLKTSGPTLPATGVNCSCALGTGLVVTNITDTGQALTSYTPNPIGRITSQFRLDDSSYSVPELIIGPAGVYGTIQGGLDASMATLTAPFRIAIADPGTCDLARREFYFNTATSQLRYCSATNVWSSLAGGGGGGGSYYQTFQNQGATLNQRTVVNFGGSGVTCADDVSNARTNCSVAATVSSVGLTAPAEFTVAGSPVSASGTLVVTKASQSANTVWAGPGTGVANQPTFRALVDADLPATAVRTSRQVTAGTGLSGGGALSSDVTLSVASNTTNQQVQILRNGTLIGTRHAVNLIPGSNISYTVTDNAASDRVDLTVAATGTGYNTIQDSTGAAQAAETILQFKTPFTAVDDPANLRTQVGINGISTLGSANQLVSSTGTGWQYLGLGTGLTVAGSNVIVNTSTIPTYSSAGITPGSCTQYGQVFFNTANSSGQKMYYCNGAIYEQIIGAGSSAYSTIQSQGSPLTARTTVNFSGAGVSCADDVGNTRTNCSIPATVSSVALAAPAEFTISGSPITGTGTLTIAKASQTANYVWAGPSSGVANQPTFRALVDADLPSTAVRTTRQVIAGTGLTGGGALSGDVTLTVAANTTNQQVQVYNNGTLVGTRKAVNLIPGTNISYTVADNSGSDRVDVTVTASGTGYATVQNAAGTSQTARSIVQFQAPFSAADDAPNTRTQVGITGLTTVGTANQIVASTGSAWQYLGVGSGLTVAASNLIVNTGTIPTYSSAAATPGSCTQYGQVFWNTANGSGQKMYYCNGATYEQIVGAGTSGYTTIQSQGTSVTARNTLNFSGSGVSCADDVTNVRTNCNIPATVSSVGLAVPGEFSVSGSPVTGSGTLTFSKTNEPANYIWAGPTSGVATAPVFRALVDADIPATMVRSTRQVVAGGGLLGGGALSADVTLSVADNTTTQRVQVLNNGTLVGTRHAVNLIPGTNISYTVADNVGSDRVDVTVTASGTGYNAIQNSAGVAQTARTTVQFQTPFTATDDAGNGRTQIGLNGITTVGSANQLVASSGTAWQYLGVGSGLTVASSNVVVNTATIPTYSSAGAVPGSCTQYGQIFWNTANSSGQKMYYCNGTTYEQITGGSGGYGTIQSQGATLTARTTVNFSGSGVSCADDITNTRTNCVVPATVYSVALSAPTEFTVSGSPITGSGTLTFTKAVQSANTVWSGPTSGAAAAPGFRALVDADIPSTLVRTSRQILTDASLSGGGNLSADRTLSVVANTTNQKVQIVNNGTLVGTRKAINFVPGSNISYTVADNSGSDRVDVTVNATGTGYSTIQDSSGNPVTQRGTAQFLAPFALADDAVNTRTKVSINGLLSAGGVNQLVSSTGSGTWQYLGVGSGLTIASSNIVLDTSAVPSYATGTTVPGSCSAYGQIFFNTAAAVGGKLNYCNGTTYETVTGGGGGGLPGGASGNQLLGENAGGTTAEWKTISGAANQINVAHSVGAIVLSTPQSIATTSDVTFNTVTTTGNTTANGFVANAGLYTSAAGTTTEFSSNGSGDALFQTWDTTVNIGTATFRAGQCQGATCLAGMTYLTGGDITSGTNTGNAGDVSIRSGNTAGTGLPGKMQIQQVFKKGTIAANYDVVCQSADWTVSDCPTNSATWLGITQNGGSAGQQNILYSGVSNVVLDGTAGAQSAGAYVCTSATGGKAVVQATPCANGQQIGYLTAAVGASATSGVVMLNRAGGNVDSNTTISVDSEIALFSGTGGKTIKRATGSGVAKIASGVLGVVSGTGTDCVKVDGTSGSCGGVGGGGVTLVQSAVTAVASSSSAAANFTNNTAGNLLIAVDRYGNQFDAPSIIDTAGNTWTQLVLHRYTQSTNSIVVYYAKNCKAYTGTNTVTITWTNSPHYTAIAIFEFSGADPTDPIDAYSHSDYGSTMSTTYTATGLAAKSDKDYLMLFANYPLAVNWTADTADGYSILQSNTYMAVEGKVAGVAGFYGGYLTSSVSEKPDGVFMAIRPFFAHGSPLDRTAIVISEDFIGSGFDTYKPVGSGYFVNDADVAPTLAYQDASDANHPGVLRQSSGAASGNWSGFRTKGKTFLGNATGWEFMEVVALPDITSIAASIGMIDNVPTSSVAGMYFWFDTSQTAPINTNWQVRTCAASTCTTTDTGIALTAGSWYTLQFRLQSAGTLQWQINGGGWNNVTTNLPGAVAMYVESSVKTNTTAARSEDVDLMALSIQAINR